MNPLPRLALLVCAFALVAAAWAGPAPGNSTVRVITGDLSMRWDFGPNTAEVAVTGLRATRLVSSGLVGNWNITAGSFTFTSTVYTEPTNYKVKAEYTRTGKLGGNAPLRMGLGLPTRENWVISMACDDAHVRWTKTYPDGRVVVQESDHVHPIPDQMSGGGKVKGNQLMGGSGAQVTTSSLTLQPIPPVFVDPTPADGQELTATVGEVLDFSVAASNPDSHEEVNLTWGELPNGMGTTGASGKNPVSAPFLLSPTLKDVDRVFVMPFIAETRGLRVGRTFRIRVKPPSNPFDEVQVKSADEPVDVFSHWYPDDSQQEFALLSDATPTVINARVLLYPDRSLPPSTRWMASCGGVKERGHGGTATFPVTQAGEWLVMFFDDTNGDSSWNTQEASRALLFTVRPTNTILLTATKARGIVMTAGQAQRKLDVCGRALRRRDHLTDYRASVEFRLAGELTLNRQLPRRVHRLHEWVNAASFPSNVKIVQSIKTKVDSPAAIGFHPQYTLRNMIISDRAQDMSWAHEFGHTLGFYDVPETFGRERSLMAEKEPAGLVLTGAQARAFTSAEPYVQPTPLNAAAIRGLREDIPY